MRSTRSRSRSNPLAGWPPLVEGLHELDVVEPIELSAVTDVAIHHPLGFGPLPSSSVDPSGEW